MVDYIDLMMVEIIGKKLIQIERLDKELGIIQGCMLILKMKTRFMY